MSLINDVLRQVDSNATAGVREDVAAIMPVPVTYTARNNLAVFIFASVSSLLVFILIFQLTSEKTVFSLFEKDYKNSDTSISSSQTSTSELYTVLEKPKSSMGESIAIDSTSGVSLLDISVDDSSIDDSSVVDSSVVDSSSINDSHSVSGRNDLKKNQKPKASIINSKPNSNARNNTLDKTITLISSQPLDVKAGESPAVADEIERENINSVTISSKSLASGEKEYQKALQLFIDDNLKLSDQYIKLAIKKNNLEKYHALQARIYIKQKDSDKFYSLVKDHPNNSLDWFKLIAPGLQLFSYYQLSNKYYYSLAEVEPDQIRWKLAIALNYSRLGDDVKAISTYKELYESDQVSNQQRQWLIQKIERLSAEKG